MKRFGLLILAGLALLSISAASLSYSGPGNRSGVLGSEVRLFVCDSTQYEGGPHIWRYRDWLDMFAPEGSAQALAWMAAYQNMDDPATPGCNSGRKGVWVWGLVQTTLTYPAVALVSTRTCAGYMGWCSRAEFDLGGVETIPGQRVTSIESSLTGVICTINAPSGSCKWTPPDGIFTANFWANSSFGDSSLYESYYWKVDSTPPDLAILVPPPDGANGWFHTPPTLSLAASDATSGLRSAALFDGGGATRVVSSDGLNTISATALDVPGNTATRSVQVKLDQSPPAITFSPNGKKGNAGWFTSPVWFSLDITDITSGVESAQYRLDDGPFEAGSYGQIVVVGNGSHTISMQALDVAGNLSTAENGLQVDSTPPSLFVSVPAADGLNGWYVSSPTFSLSGDDMISGLASALFANGQTTTTVNTDGVFTISATAKDNAGNNTPYSLTVKKDATPPVLSIPLAPDGSNGWYVTLPTLSLSANDVTSGVASALFSNGKVTTSVPADGIYNLSASAVDAAGNTISTSQTIQADTTPPSVFIPASPDGANGWYVSFPTVSLLASDGTSGLASAAFSSGQPTALIATDGTFSLSASAADLAGNTSLANRTIQVDTTEPVLSLSKPYAPDGKNGWYVTRPVLTLTAIDATSGLEAASFSDGSSSFVATDGIQIISASAKDMAGNTTVISETLKVDTIPPTLTPSISGSGSNGWYNTPVTVSLNTMDCNSGIGQTEFRLDGGEWYAGSGLIVSSEGEHAIDMRVMDNAGNTTSISRSFRVDITPPVSAFSNPLEGTQIKAAGTVVFTGTSTDALSGLAASEISLDGGATWLALPTEKGNWSYSWDTQRIPDGTYTILVHADDLVGNRENTARVLVVVGNKPPKVDVSQAWWLWEAGYIKVQPGQIPMRDGSLRISCAPYHADVVLKYTPDDIPTELKWDRLCGNGAYAAESGDYAVTVTACDTFGHCAQDSGVIRVPFIAPVMPTWTPTVEPSPTTFEPARPKPTSTQQVVVLVTPVPAPDVPKPEPPAPSQSSPLWVWVLTAFVLGFTFVSLSDPRPRALQRLAQTIQKMEFPHE